jgi:hypothetical protein
VPAPFVLLISLLLGTWTHLAWDSLTHTRGWMVLHVPLLQAVVVVIHVPFWRDPGPVDYGHELRVCHLLWYLSSFFGVAVLCYVYEKWLGSTRPATAAISRAKAIRNAVLVGLLVLPLEALHHLIGNLAGFALVGACSIGLMIFVALKIDNPVSGERPEKP